MTIRSLLAPLLALVLLLPAGRVRADSAKAQELFKGALEENRNRNFSTAFKLLADAQKEDPNVLAQDDEGLLQNVETWLQEQLDKNDGDVDAHFQMGELRVIQGLPDEALTHYQKVVSIGGSSPLAALAQPLVDDLKAQGAGRSGGSGSAAAKPTETPSGPSTSQLQDEVNRLQSELASAQNEIASLKEQIAAQGQPTDSGAELERLKQEFDEYKKQAENWRTFHNLYFAEKGRR